MDEVDISWAAARGGDHQVDWTLLNALDQPDWQERALCAQTFDERFGIWGGLSERERRRLKRGAV